MVTCESAWWAFENGVTPHVTQTFTLTVTGVARATVRAAAPAEPCPKLREKPLETMLAVSQSHYWAWTQRDQSLLDSDLPADGLGEPLLNGAPRRNCDQQDTPADRGQYWRGLTDDSVSANSVGAPDRRQLGQRARPERPRLKDSGERPAPTLPTLDQIHGRAAGRIPAREYLLPKRCAIEPARITAKQGLTRA